MLVNIAEIFELLFDKNNNVAYKALQELQRKSEETDCVYPFIDRLSVKLSRLFDTFPKRIFSSCFLHGFEVLLSL